MLYLSTTRGVMVSKLDEQTIVSEFDFQWVTNQSLNNYS